MELKCLFTTHMQMSSQSRKPSSPLKQKHLKYIISPLGAPIGCIRQEVGFVVVSTHSLDSCLWGVSNHPAFGPPASLSLLLASSSITPAGSVHKSRGDSVVRMWVQLKRWCASVLQRRHSGDECDLASTLGKYDLRKGDLFVLSWARVRRVRRGSLSSELLMCGRGVCSILLLPLVARCLEKIDVCIWRRFVYMSVVVTV